MARPLRDLTGLKFGSLLVTSRGVNIVARLGGTITTWHVICDCGKELNVRGRHLTSGNTQSCGCLKVLNGRKLGTSIQKSRGISLSFEVSSFRKLLRSYVSSAKNRGFQWNLNEAEFQLLIKSSCHYCGSPPQQRKGYERKHYLSASYKANGIDRKDSAFGYFVGNVVPCCWNCNQIKGKIPYEQFVQHLKKIASYQFSLHNAIVNPNFQLSEP